MEHSSPEYRYKKPNIKPEKHLSRTERATRKLQTRVREFNIHPRTEATTRNAAALNIHGFQIEHCKQAARAQRKAKYES